MTITAAQVQHVATLARLELSPPAASKLTHELSLILQYIKLLNEVDTHQVPPTTHPLDLSPPGLRPDAVTPSLPRPAALGPAPSVQDGMFRVPRVLED